MGCCATSDPTDVQVQRELDAEIEREMKENKVLILGAYRSGKTTLFKQLQYIYSDGNGFTDADKQKFQAPIWEQMVDALQTMIKVITDVESEYNVFKDEAERQQTQIDPAFQSSVDFILGLDGQSGVYMCTELAIHMERLWNDEAIQLVFDRRAKACVCDSTEHYMNDIGRVCNKNYIPTDEDLLLVRYTTLGMTEKVFLFGPNPDIFRFVDVGGTPNGLYSL